MHQCSHYNSIVLHKKHTASIVMGIPKEHQQQQEQNKYERIVPIKYLYIIMIPIINYFGLKIRRLLRIQVIS